MRYTVTTSIGDGSLLEGWKENSGEGGVELRKNDEVIRVKIKDNRVAISDVSDGGIFLIRKNKIAKLPLKTEGGINVDDEIWLLNQEAEIEFTGGKRNNFNGAAAQIKFFEEEDKAVKEIFVNERSYSQEKDNRKINFFLGLIVFVLLLLGTFFGYQKKSQAEQEEKFDNTKAGVEGKIMEINSVRALNIDTALELAKDAESILENSGVTDKKYTENLLALKKQIDEIKKGLGAEDVNYEVAYDTTALIGNNSEFEKMSISGEILYLWSQKLGQINMVDVNLKSTEKIVNDEKIKNWKGIFNNGEKWYGYNDSEIYEIKRNEIVASEISGVEKIEDITGWNGLIYVLDSGKQNIIKLNGNEGREWLQEENKFPEEVSGMAIDSNIWVLGKSGKIYKYNRGEEEDFKSSYIPNESLAKDIVTTDKVEFLAYVSSDNTVIIYGKDGKILNKYNFGKNIILDIEIENSNQAVLVLCNDGKIYRVKIK